MSEKELREFKADGENSSIADPVTPAGGETGKNRLADLKKKSYSNSADKVEDLEGQNKGEKLIGGQKGMSQAASRKADNRSVKEHVDTIFDGVDIAEELKEKIAIVFEAAVIERVAEKEAELEEAFEAAVKQHEEELAENVDQYLNYVVENWLEENELALESATKVAVAESFMEGLVALFNEHNIVLPEDGFDVVAEMESTIADLEAKLNESEAENIELLKLISEASEAEIIEEISEGLTETQKDKLNTFAENIEYETIDEFRTKLEAIKESFVSKTVKVEDQLNEEFDGTASEEKSYLDPTMASYVAAASRTLKK